MRIISANISGSFTLNGVDVTNVTVSSSIWSGSMASRVSSLEQFSSSLDATYATDAQLAAATASLSASLALPIAALNSYTSSNSTTISALNAQTASLLAYTSSNDANISALNSFSSSILSYTSSNNATIASINSYTSSANTKFAGLDVASGSAITRLNALEVASGSAINRLSSLETASGSAITRLISLENRTGSYATTGSNVFAGGQYFSSSFNPTGFTTTASLYTDGGIQVTRDAYFSSSLFIKGNLTVFGTQSVAYISSSQLNIGTNIISVNTDTPSIRFGGLAVYDSGSTGLTGSMLWDSQDNQWIYSNPSGSAYDSALFLVGPRSAGPLGNEVGISCNFLSKGNGMHHMTSSGIFEDGSRTCFYGNTVVSSSGTVCTTMANASCVGIGTTTPCSTLHVATGPNTDGIFLGRIAACTNKHAIFLSADQSVGAYIAGGTNPDGTATQADGVGRLILQGGQTEGFQFQTSCVAGGAAQSWQTRLKIFNSGIACFACQVCAPAFVGGTVNGTTGTFTGNIVTTGATAEIMANGAGSSNTVGGSSRFTILDSLNTRGWILQQNASYNLSFWHFNGGWSNIINFTPAGAVTFSSTVDGTIINSTSNAFRFSGNNALSLVSLCSQNVVKINAAGYWGTQLVGANDQGILINNVGNVGIGDIAPSSKLEVKGANTDQIRIAQDAGSTTKLHLGQFADASYIFNNYAFVGGHTTDDATKGSSGIILDPASIIFQTAPASASPSRATRLTIAANGTACFACELTAKTLGTNDLILNNLNYECANYVDGTRGSWLIQEGACDLFIINQVSCKKYKFNLIEIE